MTIIKAPILISIISALIAFSSMFVSIWYSKRTLEQNKRHRVDSLKQATFSKVLEGFQEIMQVISELLSKRDYVRNVLATNEYDKAQKKVEANLNELDVLKWKWITLLPNQFINECDKFRLVYKNWMLAQRNIDSEGKE